MRTSLLTRSAIAVASLAIGSVALTAAPATADAPSGVTRELVVNTAYRYTDDDSAPRALIQKVCGPGTISDFSTSTLSYSADVDGVLVQAFLDYQDGVENSGRYCTFAALVTSAPFASLSGTVTITPNQLERVAAPTGTTSQLSGDVFVTKPIADSAYAFSARADAAGDVVKVEQAKTSSTRVSKPKSTAYKNKALKSYKRSVAKAQAELAKALEKAGNSSSKKAAARKEFRARKKAAKALLHIRWSSDKKTVVTTTVGKTTKTSFSISTINND